MFWERVKSAFRETPWTMTLIAINLVVWLFAFFGAPAPMALLSGTLDVPHAWRWVTYPLATPSVALWLVLGLFCFYLFASQLERMWGSLRYGRAVLILTILGAVAQWLGIALASRTPQPTVSVAGISVLAGAIFMAWCSLNRQAELRLFFVIPIQAKYLALATVVFTFLNPGGPLVALPLALLYAGCWFWAARGQAQLRTSQASAGRSLKQWWNERQKAKRKGRFQLLEGGAPLASPPRVGTLQSLKKTPPSKVDEPSQKELDRILDKIRFEGMNALTPAERQTLDSQSRRLRGDD